MLKKTKKRIGLALTLGVIGALSFGAASVVTANADVPVDMQSFVMENGAAVRLASDGNGLRFSAEMNGATYEALEAKNAAYGMLIVPADYITSGYELTVENVFGENAKYCFQNDTPQSGQKQIINAVSQSLSDKDGDGLYELYGSIVDLYTWNIARSFVGQAYVNVDGAYYFATPYNGDVKNNTRSMYYVSQLAIEQNDGNATTLKTMYIDTFDTYNKENGNKKYKYTVNHIFRKADGSTETVTETKGAYLNSTVTETGNEYAGYILDEASSDSSKTIYANGNTVFNLYYDTYKNVAKSSGNVTLCTAEELGANVFGVTLMAKLKTSTDKPNIYFSGNGGTDWNNVTRVDGAQVGDWYAYEIDFRSGYDYGSGANPVGLIGDFSVTNQDKADVEIKKIQYITEKTISSDETWINAARISDEYTALTYKIKPSGTMTGAFYVGNNDVTGAAVVGIDSDKLSGMTPDEDGFYTFAYNPQDLLGGNLKFIHNDQTNVAMTIKDLRFSDDTLVADGKSLTLKTYDEVKDYNILTFKVKLVQGSIKDNALWYGYNIDNKAFDKNHVAAMTPDADGYYTLTYDLAALKTAEKDFSVYNQTTGTDMLIKDVRLLKVDKSVASGTTDTLATYAEAKAYETISFKAKPAGAVNGAAYIYGNSAKCVQGLDENKLSQMTADEDGYYTFTFNTIDLYGQDLSFQNGFGCAVYIKDVTFNGTSSFVYLADNAESTLASYEEVKDYSLLSFKVKLVDGAITDNALWYGYANDKAFDKNNVAAMTPDADGYYTLYYDLGALKEDSTRVFKVFNQNTGTDMIVKDLSLCNDLILAKKGATTLISGYAELKNYAAISFQVKPIGTTSGTLYYGYMNDDGVDADELSAIMPDTDGYYILYYDLTNLNAALTANFSVNNLIGTDCLIKNVYGVNLDYVIGKGKTETIVTYEKAKAYKTISFKLKPLGTVTGVAYWYGISTNSSGAGASEFAAWTSDADGFYTCTFDVVKLYGEDLYFTNGLGTKALIKDITLVGEADSWYVKAGVTEQVVAYEKAKAYYSFTFKMKPMSEGAWSSAAYWYGDVGVWNVGLGSDTTLTADDEGFYTQTVLVSNLAGHGLTFQNSSSSDMLLKDFVFTKEIALANNQELTIATYDELCAYNSLSFKVKLVNGSITDNALWYGYANEKSFNKDNVAAMTPDADGYYTLYYDLGELKEDSSRSFKVYNQNTGTDMIVKDVTYGMERYSTAGKTICLATYEELQAYGAVVLKVKPNGTWTQGALWYGHSNDVGFGFDTTQTPDENGWYTLVYDLTTLKANQASLKLSNQDTNVMLFVSEWEGVDYAIKSGITPSIIAYSDVQSYKTVSFKMKLFGTRTGDVYWYGDISRKLIGGFGDGEVNSWMPDENGYYTVVFNVSDLYESDFKVQNGSGATVLIKDISYADDYCFVNNGVAAYSIAIPSAASATEEYAADELQYFIEQMTGATVDIISEAAVKSSMQGRLIYIGQTTKAKNALTIADSFGIYLEDGDVIIEGQNKRGTLYGVYDFLETCFGIKFLSDSYTYVPVVNGTLTLSEAVREKLNAGYVSEPAIAYRAYLNTPVWATNADDIRYATRMRFLNEFIGERTAVNDISEDLLEETQYSMSWFSNELIGASHSSIDYAAVGVYALRDNITDWESLITYSLHENGTLASCSVNREYALANYASIFDGNGVLDVCYASGVGKDTTNLITAKSLIVAGMEYVMTNYAQAEWYMLGQQDKDTRCTCSVCSEKTTVSGGGFWGIGAKKYTDYKYSKSYYIATFVKAVAEQLLADGYMQQKVVMFAYGSTGGDAPGQMTYNSSNKYYDYSTKLTVSLPSNVWVQWAPINGDEYFAVNSSSFGLSSQLSDWKTYCLGGENRFMVWTYETIFDQYYVYAPTMHTWAENIKTFREYGMNYVFMQSTFTDRVNPDQYMEAYVASKLLWNASTDTDAMNALITEYKNEFIEYFYGATAASYIEEYYTTFDAEYATLYGSIGYLQSNDSGKVWVLGQLPHNDMGAIPTQDFLNGLVAKLEGAVAAVNADTSLTQAQKTQYVEHINRLKLTPRYMLVSYYGAEDSTLYSEMKAFGGMWLGENVAIPA